MPEKEGSFEGGLGMKVETKADEEEDGVINSNEVVLSDLEKKEETSSIKP